MAGRDRVRPCHVGRRRRVRGSRLRLRSGLGDDSRPGPRRHARRRSHREMALAEIHPGDRGNDLTIRECACGWSRDPRERLGCLRGRPGHFRDRPGLLVETSLRARPRLGARGRGESPLRRARPGRWRQVSPGAPRCGAGFTRLRRTLALDRGASGSKRGRVRRDGSRDVTPRR